MLDPELAQIDRGRLFQLKLRHNAASRAKALESIRQTSPRIGGMLPAIWRVRIGGRMRGRTDYFYSREAAEKAVHDHYNELMMQFIEKGKR